MLACIHEIMLLIQINVTKNISANAIDSAVPCKVIRPITKEKIKF